MRRLFALAAVVAAMMVALVAVAPAFARSDNYTICHDGKT
jgi:hypothetical protein